MGVFSWMGRKLGLKDVDGWRQFLGTPWAGKPVNAANALELSAWWRGVKLYCEVAGATPIKMYQYNRDGSRARVTSHELAYLIGLDPNSEQTSQEFWGAQAAGLTILGNSYAEKMFIGDRLVALEQLPFETLPERDPKTNKLSYYYNDRGKKVTLSADKVFHTKGFGFGGDLGLSPLAFARQTLSIGIATEQAAGQTFTQGMRASGFFTGPKLDPTQRADFTKTFIDPIVGNDASAHYGILENGFDFKTINIPPKDAEMLMSRRFNVEEIARYLGVPPILLGHSAEGQTMWGSGVEAIVLQWLTLGLDAFFSNIERSINKRLLTSAERRKFFFEYDRRSLLQADSTARGELYWKLMQIAAITPNMVCDAENFPRFVGGDIRLVNSTLTPVDQLGKKPEQPALPAPAAPTPETEQ